MTRPTSKQIILATLVSESLLLALGLCLSLYLGSAPEWKLTFYTVVIGGLMTIPPFAANVLLWQYSRRSPDSIYNRFSVEVIIPLCQAMTIPTALVVAILSGICEEFFFRGALNDLMRIQTTPEVACLVTSIIFAAIHFLGNLKRYGQMIPLYVVMGCYLWLVHYATESLACVAITHGLYNFCVIILTKKNSTDPKPLR